MQNVLSFFTSFLVVYSGFTFAFYGIYAKSMIDKISSNAYSQGIEINSQENLRYFSNKFDKWKTGSFCSSPLGLLIGFIIIIGGSLITLKDNSWWTIIISIILGYYVYLKITFLFGWVVSRQINYET